MNGKIFIKVFSATTVILLVFMLVIIVSNVNIGTKSGDDLECLDTFEKGSPKNILVMGTDLSGLRSDVMMIFSISGDKKTINSVSIPRDSRMSLNNGYLKLNSALQIGGDEFAIKKIKEVTGIPIHEYVKVNFNAVIEIIDALGGVKFDVPQDMNYEDPYQDLYIHLTKGEQVLNGEQSLQLLRFRSYPMGDLARIEVQQSFMNELFKQKAKLRYVSKVSKIYNSVNENVTTSLSKSEIVSLAKTVRKGEMNTLEFPTYISPSGTYVLVDKPEAEEFVNNYFK
jgi:LCP family protein required for cell wall assembly